jgi:hypothetical protein
VGTITVLFRKAWRIDEYPGRAAEGLGTAAGDVKDWETTIVERKVDKVAAKLEIRYVP